MDINQILSNVVTAIIVTAVPLLVAKVIQLTNAKIDAIQKNTKDAKLNNAIDKAQNIVGIVVSSVSQTYVDSIKKDNGSLDPEQQKKALSLAIDKAQLLIGDESKKAIQEIYGDFDEFLRTTIESYVKQNRK